jgi:proline iminopeptidase
MYPSIEPYDSGHLDVGDGHTVYWEVVGSPDGLPAVWLHGGPGAPTSAGRRSFDPARYRAVLFDQRGCGRSRPLASDPDADLSTNTTDHLVADMERLRSHLGIDRWVVVGGSWGVTLALVYAQRHPERVLGMALAAVTSGRWRETQWITRDMGRVFPRQWDRFVELLPEAERGGDLAAAYARLLAGPLDTAWELHKAWPASRLVVADDAGHFGGSMYEQFIAAIDAMADQVAV